MKKPQLMRVATQNYRSLRQIDVHLSDITVLVGPNGSGKSNFLQALRFVRNVLKQDLDAALLEEGNFVTTKTPATIHHFDDITIALYFRLNGQEGFFEVSIGESEEYGIALKSEKCQLGPYGYTVDASKITSSNLPEGRLISGFPSRLGLSVVTFFEELAPLHPVYEFLSNWTIYSFFPNTLRLPQKPFRGRPYLHEQGSNLSTVLQHFLERI
jgi:energy-coupling factor transporter ATP-binding protein EcfA2